MLMFSSPMRPSIRAAVRSKRSRPTLTGIFCVDGNMRPYRWRLPKASFCGMIGSAQLLGKFSFPFFAAGNAELLRIVVPLFQRLSLSKRFELSRPQMAYHDHALVPL